MPNLPPVLIVDDDPEVLRGLTFALEAEGRRVVALANLAQAAAYDGLARAACIILDQSLPDGTGLEFLLRLRAGANAVPVIIITTNPSGILIDRARDLAAEVIEKPLIGDRLFNR